MKNTPEITITRNDAARRAGVKVRTVDYWRRTGKITTYTNDLGHVRLDPEEIDALISLRPKKASA